MREATNAAEHWDLRSKMKVLANTVDGLTTNSIELSRLLNSIADGIRTWTPAQQSVLYAHLDILQDVILRCLSSTVAFKTKVQEVRNWVNP